MHATRRQWKQGRQSGRSGWPSKGFAGDRRMASSRGMKQADVDAFMVCAWLPHARKLGKQGKGVVAGASAAGLGAQEPSYGGTKRQGIGAHASQSAARRISGHPQCALDVHDRRQQRLANVTVGATTGRRLHTSLLGQAAHSGSNICGGREQAQGGKARRQGVREGGTACVKSRGAPSRADARSRPPPPPPPRHAGTITTPLPPQHQHQQRPASLPPSPS